MRFENRPSDIANSSANIWAANSKYWLLSKTKEQAGAQLLLHCYRAVCVMWLVSLSEARQELMK